MASTQLSDIFVADYYGTLEPVNSPEKTAVYESGIITRSATLDNIAKNGQGTSEISYWQDLDADGIVGSGDLVALFAAWGACR